MACDKERLSKEILGLEKAIALAYSNVSLLEAELEDLKEEFFSLSGEDELC